MHPVDFGSGAQVPCVLGEDDYIFLALHLLFDREANFDEMGPFLVPILAEKIASLLQVAPSCYKL